MQTFTMRAIETIRTIPPGKVMTYGQVAACAGSPRGARQVVRILHAMSGKHDLPWHRVINRQGQIVLRDPVVRAMQIDLLRREGVEVSPDGQVDLAKYRFINPIS